MGKNSKSIVFQTTKQRKREEKEEFPQPIIVEKTTLPFDGRTFLQTTEVTKIKWTLLKEIQITIMGLCNRAQPVGGCR